MQRKPVMDIDIRNQKYPNIPWGTLRLTYPRLNYVRGTRGEYGKVCPFPKCPMPTESRHAKGSPREYRGGYLRGTGGSMERYCKNINT